MTSSNQQTPAFRHPHDHTEEEIDQFEVVVDRSGCREQHESLQICFVDSKDWRKCENEMKLFKECMDSMNRRRRNQKNQN